MRNPASSFKLPLQRLAILDWGIGGLGLLRLLLTVDPDWPITYFSDAGHAPYGKVRHDNLRARVTAIAHWLNARGVTHLAVACNAASTAFADDFAGNHATRRATRLPLHDGGTMRVTTVVQHALTSPKLCAKRQGRLQVGVVGGRGTIESDVYGGLRSRHDLQQRIAQPLSAYVEAGELDSPKLREELRRILRPLKHLDLLIFGCTHYPALSALFQEALPQVTLLDPAQQMAAWITKRWASTRALALDGGPAKGRVFQSRTQEDVGASYFTTGSAASMKRAARAAFGVRIERAESVPLAL